MLSRALFLRTREHSFESTGLEQRWEAKTSPRQPDIMSVPPGQESRARPEPQKGTVRRWPVLGQQEQQPLHLAKLYAPNNVSEIPSLAPEAFSSFFSFSGSAREELAKGRRISSSPSRSRK